MKFRLIQAFAGVAIFVLGLAIGLRWNRNSAQTPVAQKTSLKKRHEPTPPSVENEAQQITTNENTLALTQLPPTDQRCEEGKRLIQKACGLEHVAACESNYADESQTEAVIGSILARCKTNKISDCHALLQSQVKEEAAPIVFKACFSGNVEACESSIDVYARDSDRIRFSEPLIFLCKNNNYKACALAWKSIPLHADQLSFIRSKLRMAVKSGNTDVCKGIFYGTDLESLGCDPNVSHPELFEAKEPPISDLLLCKQGNVDACINVVPRWNGLVEKLCENKNDATSETVESFYSQYKKTLVDMESVGQVVFSVLLDLCKKSDKEACWALGQEYVKSCPDSEQSP